MSQEKYIYQISTNPALKNETSFLGYEEDFSFSLNREYCVMTGMNNSLHKTIETIGKSALVYIAGEIDHTTFFELGLAISLNKTVYYVTEQQENIFQLQLPYELENIIRINYQNFIQLIDEL